MAIDGVLFDCDGVLVDSEIVGLEDCATWLADHGLTFTVRELITRFTGMRTDALASGLRAGYDEALGRPATDREFSDLMDGFISARRARRHEMTVVEGAERAAGAANRVFAGRMAVASSSAQTYLDDKMRRYDLARYFDGHIYSAEHVDRGKPAPDIFLFAADRLGLAPTACLVIEDSPHGVRAGVAAGATVWGFTGGGHCFDDHGARLIAAGAEEIIEDHAELARRFETWG